MEPEAAKLFRQLAKRLPLDTVDRNVLTTYCVCWCRWKQAEEEISRNGVVIESPHGKKASPAIKIADAYARQCRYFGELLGLSPLARERIAMPEKDKAADDLQQFIEFRAAGQ